MARRAFLFVALSIFPIPLLAESSAQFDVPSHVTAEDVTTSEFIAKHPGEKLIRVTVPISTLVTSANETELVQCLFLISGSQTAPFQIIEHQPTTTLSTDIEGLVATERSDDVNTSLGLTASAPQDFPVRTNADARFSSGSRLSEKLSRLPSKRLLSASGTMHRGVSAYFKLKPSTQTTLEGSKDFVIAARVRDTWRAGMLYVNCAAYGKKHQSARGFVVGTYLAGDQDAKESVQNLAHTQAQLRRLAVRHESRIDDRRYPSLGHRVGGVFSVVKPKIPKQWLNQLLTSNDYHRFERHLPQEIQHAATTYREARERIIVLTGQI